ncbi:MAG: type IV pili methyl-accepting chemotaxis transducer N-terminal domain-containing protein [Alphaproteobacteria bacterium]|nr:type IV pili methyl-accepting chemotaxis transducer N-terminal domain-containing protein [Alphaproteobacteria bacterium]
MFLRRLCRQGAVIALMPVFALSFAFGGHAESQDAPAQTAARAAAPAAAIATGPGKSAVLRLNLIDRQRMLGEMMAKGLCFIDLKVEKKLHRNQMSVAQYVFHSTLDNLVEGSPGLELPPEQRPELKNAIEEIKLAWVKYAEPLNSWTGGRWGKKQFALKVYEVDEEYEKQLSETIELYRKVLLGAGAVSEDTTLTILAAGRQRTLTQQMAKQFCQALSGYKPEETRERLQQTLALYKDVAGKFNSGDKEVGLSGGQPGLILDNIQLATTAFEKIEPVLKATVEGGTPTPEEQTLVAGTTLELLRHWEKVVATYVQLN